MPLLRRVTPAQRDKLDPKGLAGLATRQHGVVDRGQLESLGISPSAISRWVAAGRLHRIHPGVYAVGHSALSLGGRLRAALLYAGSNAAFSHTTAAWLWRLIDAEPNRIHKTARGRRSSLPGVRLHHSPGLEIVDCRGLPVTGLARTLLDIAGILSLRELRRALAEAEYRRLLRPAEVLAVTGSGRHGSRALRWTLENHRSWRRRSASWRSASSRSANLLVCPSLR
jgi:predicted transcriptional regulator of viral defense system